MLHSGIDLHKQTFVIAIVDPDGRPVRDVQLSTKREAIHRYLASLPLAPTHQRAVVESTSNWYWLRDLLTAQGIDLRLARSKHVKAISYAGRPNHCERRELPTTARRVHRSARQPAP